MRIKISKQPPPAPTASAVGPCPTLIQIVGRSGTGSLPSTIAPPDHPPFSRRAVVSYWRRYVHEVLVNRLGGLSLPMKSVVRLPDRPDMTLDVYRGRKITTQRQQQKLEAISWDNWLNTSSGGGFWLVGLGFNGPFRQYFSLYRAVSKREGERGERKDR